MTNAATRVRLSEALEPFVLAMDVGSTASRGDVFDASGRPLKGGRVKVPHHFTTGGDGTSEIDPDVVVGEIEQISPRSLTDRLPSGSAEWRWIPSHPRSSV